MDKLKLQEKLAQLKKDLAKKQKLINKAEKKEKAQEHVKKKIKEHEEKQKCSNSPVGQRSSPRVRFTEPSENTDIASIDSSPVQNSFEKKTLHKSVKAQKEVIKSTKRRSISSIEANNRRGNEKMPSEITVSKVGEQLDNGYELCVTKVTENNRKLTIPSSDNQGECESKPSLKSVVPTGSNPTGSSIQSAKNSKHSDQLVDGSNHQAVDVDRVRSESVSKQQNSNQGKLADSSNIICKDKRHSDLRESDVDFVCINSERDNASRLESKATENTPPEIKLKDKVTCENSEIFSDFHTIWEENKDLYSQVKSRRRKHRSLDTGFLLDDTINDFVSRRRKSVHAISSKLHSPKLYSDKLNISLDSGKIKKRGRPRKSVPGINPSSGSPGFFSEKKRGRPKKVKTVFTKISPIKSIPDSESTERSGDGATSVKSVFSLQEFSTAAKIAISSQESNSDISECFSLPDEIFAKLKCQKQSSPRLISSAPISSTQQIRDKQEMLTGKKSIESPTSYLTEQPTPVQGKSKLKSCRNSEKYSPTEQGAKNTSKLVNDKTVTQSDEISFPNIVQDSILLCDTNSTVPDSQIDFQIDSKPLKKPGSAVRKKRGRKSKVGMNKEINPVNLSPASSHVSAESSLDTRKPSSSANWIKVDEIFPKIGNIEILEATTWKYRRSATDHIVVASNSCIQLWTKTTADWGCISEWGLYVNSRPLAVKLVLDGSLKYVVSLEQKLDTKDAVELKCYKSDVSSPLLCIQETFHDCDTKPQLCVENQEICLSLPHQTGSKLLAYQLSPSMNEVCSVLTMDAVSEGLVSLNFVQAELSSTKAVVGLSDSTIYIWELFEGYLLQKIETQFVSKILSCPTTIEESGILFLPILVDCPTTPLSLLAVSPLSAKCTVIQNFGGSAGDAKYRSSSYTDGLLLTITSSGPILHCIQSGQQVLCLQGRNVSQGVLNTTKHQMVLCDNQKLEVWE